MAKLTGVSLSCISVQRGGAGTIYSQICAQLRQMILRGDLSAGTRLPSTRMFATEMAVSRITVREVYDQLVAEGYLRSAVGKGTFVNDHPTLPETVADRSRNATGNTLEINESQPKITISNRAKYFLSITPGQAALQPRPFNPALPDFNLFPFPKWNRIVKQTFHNRNYDAMDYGDSTGHPPLKEVLAHSLRLSRGVNCKPEQIVIVASSEQAIKRTVFLLLDHHDGVWFGDPGIYARRHVFRIAGANTLTVPVDDQGIVVEKIREFGGRAKLAYVLPWRHYPLGISMSLSRKLELLKWASENDAWILEDDFGSELNFIGNASPPIQSLDVDQRVLYMGGFSLTLFPALRLAYIIVPESLVAAMKKIAQSELAVATVLQPALAEFIAGGHYIAHIRKVRKIYHRREKFLVEFLEQNLGDKVTIGGIGGASNILLNLPAGIADKTLSTTLAQHRVIAHSISDYYLDKRPKNEQRNALVLGFACSSRKHLEQSARLLVDMF